MNLDIHVAQDESGRSLKSLKVRLENIILSRPVFNKKPLPKMIHCGHKQEWK